MIEYSGLVTKIRAMSKNLLSSEDYKQLAACQDFSSAIGLLRGNASYRIAFEGVLEHDLHRDACERRLMNSLYSDFVRIYHFSNLKVRNYLDVFFRHYEINILKIALRNVYNHQSSDIDIGSFYDFFHRHSSLSLDSLNRCDSLQDFFQAISGSEYSSILTPAFSGSLATLQDYEGLLDHYYFCSTWRLIHKTVSEKEQKGILELFGMDIDLLNIRWIIRCKRSFKLPAEQIKRMLIPIHYKLSDELTLRLVDADSDSEVMSVLQGSIYKKKLGENDIKSPDAAAERILYDIYRHQKRKNPYSLSTVAAYLYEKEAEISNIIRLSEAVRYGLSLEERYQYLPKNMKGVSVYDR